jgi:hypothetical protein
MRDRDQPAFDRAPPRRGGWAHNSVTGRWMSVLSSIVDSVYYSSSARLGRNTMRKSATMADGRFAADHHSLAGASRR